MRLFETAESLPESEMVPGPPLFADRRMLLVITVPVASEPTLNGVDFDERVVVNEVVRRRGKFHVQPYPVDAPATMLL